MLENIWNIFWSPVSEVAFLVDEVIKLIPYPLLFLIGILGTQGFFTVRAGFDIGAAVATRQLLHGEFLDLSGILWTLGVACGLVAWAAASKASDARCKHRRRRF